jgi:hypothetical protein
MAQVIWNPAWGHEHSVEQSMRTFRMFEAQHVDASMRLVDSADEQLFLEHLHKANHRNALRKQARPQL